jgi:hypothetical protein
MKTTINTNDIEVLYSMAKNQGYNAFSLGNIDLDLCILQTFLREKKKIYVNVELEFGKLNKYRINFCEIVKEPQWLLNGFSHNWVFNSYSTALYNAIYQGLKFNYKEINSLNKQD